MPTRDRVIIQAALAVGDAVEVGFEPVNIRNDEPAKLREIAAKQNEVWGEPG